MPAPKRRNAIAGQFSARLIVMLESPAMRVLSLTARRALDRIEIEHAHHGGKENGRLPVTYKNFEDFGLNVNAIGPAIRELTELGFIEVMRRGYGGAAGIRVPSLYRLTHRAAWDAVGDGTHEYLKIKTVAEAAAIAKAARLGADPRNVARAKKHAGKIQNATLTSREISPSETEGETPISRPRKPRVQGHPRFPRVLSISRSAAAVEETS